ncbi:MAG TPA: tetratricopeptide repeat protein [Sphingomicrobium sp.]|jgi:tetratricopeptide (TPR) repeat protein|nr:tetratricopeptide repeat protein [Sphingomicrobium sp.]
MKLITTTALALALTVTSGAAIAQREGGYGATAQQPRPMPTQTEQQPQGPSDAGFKIKPSAKALKPIIELQKAVNANDTANIPAKLAEANAAATTKEDKYIIAQLQLKAAATSNDTASAAAAIDAIAASGYLDNASVVSLYRGLGGSYYKANQFDKAGAAYEHALALQPGDEQALTMLAETRNAQGRKADAVAALQKVIMASKAAGQKPSEDIYKRALGIAYDAKLPAAVPLGRDWVASFPNAVSWRNSVAIYRNIMNPDVQDTLDLLRLLQAAGALSDAEDYQLFATAAAEQGNFVEAQNVIDAGVAAGKVNPSTSPFSEIVIGLKSKPKVTEADLAAASKTATSANALVRIGDRYYALGQYSKAVDTYRLAMAKPGADANLANLHLGMALARSGDKAGAAAALNKVSGPHAEIAKYWLVYTQTHA